MTVPHAHFETAAQDCDGLITRTYTIWANEEETASDFGDIEFTDRIVAMCVNAYSLDSTGRLDVTKLSSGEVRLEWGEPTEEGGRSTTATICSDDCEDDDGSYRDHRAESMGY